MPKINAQIVKQYHIADLFEEIFSGLKEQGIDMGNVSRDDISGVDEFHVRGSAVSNELTNEIFLMGAKVLDVGCGLGGPCRMLADKFNCKVTGIDICAEYIRTAQKLSELTGLSAKTEFIQADALNLPFESASFDIAWTQHVQMNIEDKARFYSEIKRVLTDEGAMVYYDIFSKNGNELDYPVPWANNASINFLNTVPNVDRILNELGFEKLQTNNQTAKARQFLANLLEKAKKNNLPKSGLNVLMGKETIKKLKNILKAIEENKIELQSGIYRKRNLPEDKT